VKTVYALTHASFGERILRVATFESVASAWEGEWASNRCGKRWRDMASGTTNIDMLAFSARSSAVPSGGDVGSHVLGYRSEEGMCLHFRKGCSSATEKVESDAANAPSQKCKKCWPKV
jgi:hypothetical protein